MRKPNPCCFLLLALCWASLPLTSPLGASTLANTTNFPDAVNPGQTVTIGGEFNPDKVKSGTISIYRVGTDDKPVGTVNGEAGPKAITVKLPDNLPVPGRYYLLLTYDDLKATLVPGELRTQSTVQLSSTHPTTAYKNSQGTFDFEVIGANFSTFPQDDQIYIGGDPKIGKDHRFSSAEPCRDLTTPCLWVESSEKLHVVGYKKERYEGPLLLSVGVGSARSAQKQLVLSRMSETGVLVASLAIFGVLMFILYRLVASGMRDNVIDGQHYSPFWSFFLDKQTNSYSLSKFQLLMFSSVFAFGYLYVFLCRWLVQWQFVLPDVPSSFSGILAMSAGTAVAAAGATSARGSKGAGGPRPSAADFVTVGGQVVPERFQFFAWTLIACFGFLALLVSQDPATIDKFPDFPQGLLYVMGVSAGGYLSGKVARAGGPVLRNIAWRPADPAAKVKIDGTEAMEADLYLGEFTIQGENLSSDADFCIDGVKLPIDPTAREKLVVATSQEQAASDRTFSSQLKIKITKRAQQVDMSAGDHVFRLTNKDAQFAEIRFTTDPPTITSVLMKDNPPELPSEQKVIAAGTEQVEIEVKGSGFQLGTTARWTPAKTSDAPPAAVDVAVEVKDAKTLHVTLAPGEPGTGSLLVSTPNGFSAAAMVTVVKPTS